jgi:hypothetical protein
MNASSGHHRKKPVRSARRWSRLTKPVCGVTVSRSKNPRYVVYASSTPLSHLCRWRILTLATSQPPPLLVFQRQPYHNINGPSKLVTATKERKMRLGAGSGGKREMASTRVDNVRPSENDFPDSWQ